VAAKALTTDGSIIPVWINQSATAKSKAQKGSERHLGLQPAKSPPYGTEIQLP